MTEKNAVATYETSLTKMNNALMPMISKQLENNGVNMSDYQKQCIINSISAINQMAFVKGKNTMDYANGNLTEILLNVAALQLNAAATPREVYFIERNQKIAQWVDGQKTEQWVQTIEMGIEGDGNDAILNRFGRDIEKVHRHWVVKEGDTFEYPKYKGLEYEPPAWSPKGTGEKVMKVVYPIQYIDKTVEYFIGERSEVKKNLIAHVANNLNKKEQASLKYQLLDKMETMTLDAILADDDILTKGKVSPAWKSPQSREAMIERKIRNNIVKKIPKDFSTQFEAERYLEQDEIVQSMKVVEEVGESGTPAYIIENANSKDFEETPANTPKKEIDGDTGEILDGSSESTPEPTKEPTKEKPVETKKEVEQQSFEGFDDELPPF